MAVEYGVGAVGFEVFGGGPNITTDPAVTTAASGSTFYVFDGQYLDYEHDEATSNITDNKSNTYEWAHAKLAYSEYPGASARASICWSGTGGSGHTWTAQMPDGYEGTLLVAELKGVTRIQDYQTAHRASSTTIASPTAMASQEAIVLVTIWGYGWDSGANGLTIDNDFEILAHYSADVTSLHGALAAKRVTSSGPVSCTWTISDPQAAEVTITVLEGPLDTIVSGVESPAQPTESATLFQDITLVIGNESPAAPTQYAQVTEVACPTWVATGAFGDGGTSAPIPLPAGIVKGDILLLKCESANQAVTVSDAAVGTWTQVTNSPQGTGTAGGTSATRLTVFWSRYNGTQTQPTVACTGGNHVNGCISAWRGCVPEGNPIHVSTGAVKSTSSTTTSIAGSTTTKDNCTIVAIASRMNDSAAAHYSAWTNASLAGIQEIADGGGTTGNGGGIGACCGTLATKGTYGATTATNGTTTTAGYMTIALLGVEAGTAVVSHAEQAPAYPAQTATLSNETSASVTGVQDPAAATQTETVTQPSAVAGTQAPAEATQTGTALQTNTVTGTESPTQPAQSETLSQSATVAGTESPAQPTEAGTLLQPSVVTPVQSPAAPSETATAAQQWVTAQQSPAEPSETMTLWQGSQVTGVQGPAAQDETETLSQYFVAGVQAPAAALEIGTALQPSIVSAQQAPAQPSEIATALQTNAVTGTQAPAAANETAQATQAAVVAGTQSPEQPGQVETLTQRSSIAGVESPTQPSQTEALTQPSRVVGVEVPAQPTELETLLQTNTVVALEVTAQPTETATLQQGSLVDASQSPEEPEQLATLLQNSYVSGSQSPWQPSQVLTLQATSRVDAAQSPAQPMQVEIVSTYQPNIVFGQQATAPALQWCTITTEGPTQFTYIKINKVTSPRRSGTTP